MSKHGRDRGARSAARLRGGGRMSGDRCCTFVQHGTGAACFWRALCVERRGLVSWLGLFVAFEL